MFDSRPIHHNNQTLSPRTATSPKHKSSAEGVLTSNLLMIPPLLLLLLLLLS